MIKMIIVYVVMELIATLIFTALNKLIGPASYKLINWSALLKGIIERITLITGLMYAFPQIIIAFAALKLGTRLREEQESKISNDYFLLGNMISLLLAMLYVVVVRYMLV